MAVLERKVFGCVISEGERGDHARRPVGVAGKYFATLVPGQTPTIVINSCNRWNALLRLALHCLTYDVAPVLMADFASGRS